MFAKMKYTYCFIFFLNLLFSVILENAIQKEQLKNYYNVAKRDLQNQKNKICALIREYENAKHNEISCWKSKNNKHKINLISEAEKLKNKLNTEEKVYKEKDMIFIKAKKEYEEFMVTNRIND